MFYIILFLSLLVSQDKNSYKKDKKGSYKEGELLIKFKNTASVEAQSKFLDNLAYTKNYEKNKYQDFIKLKFDKEEYSVSSLIQKYKYDDSIEYIEPNYIVSISSNPAYYSNQWAIKNTGQTLQTVGSSAPINNTNELIYEKGTSGKDINIEALWAEKDSDCSSVKIAIIDTGINPYQDEFQDIELDLYNAITNTNGEAFDLNGHGTHVAGVIASSSEKIKGICSDASLIIIKALDDTGNGTIEDLLKGINYAKDKGAKIINLSLGYQGTSTHISLRTAIRSVPNAMFIVAAGNEYANADGQEDLFDGKTYYSYPCAINEPNLICVGAVNSKFELPLFSNHGVFSVHLAAPGTNILSSYIKEYSSNSDNWGLWSNLESGWTKKSYIVYPDVYYAYQIPFDFDMIKTEPTGSINSNFNNKTIKYELNNTYNKVALSFFTTYLLTDNNKVTLSLDGENEDYTGNKLDAYINGSLSKNNCNNPCEIKFTSSYGGSNSTGGFAVFDLTVTALDEDKDNDLYKYLNGTSMSTPYVTGVFAFLKSIYPELTNNTIASAIVYSGTNYTYNETNRKRLATFNVLDAYKSYLSLKNKKLLPPVYISASINSR